MISWEDEVESSVAELRVARETLLRIVKARQDGARFVPLVLRLEREIAARADMDDAYRRILNEAA